MRSVFFNDLDGDRVYDAEDWAEYFAQFIGNGVYANPSTGMQIQSGGGLAVKVAVGACFINGHGGYADGDDVLTLDYGGSSPRIDRIVARLDVPNREIQPYIIKGEVSAVPAAPDIVRDGTYYDLCLAEISVAANATEITQADIRDTRWYTSICGYVAGLIKQVNTTDLFAQFEAAWDKFISGLADSDHVTIDTADRKARADIKAIRSQGQFADLFGII